MSNLISGRAAFNSWIDGVAILVNFGKDDLWHDFEVDTNLSAEIFRNKAFKFKLKPKTTNLNGIEIPAPFKPKEGEQYWILFESHYSDDGYKLVLSDEQYVSLAFGAWRTEEEIKQVVEALRSIFK